jgi:hypothetical protein
MDDSLSLLWAQNGTSPFLQQPDDSESHADRTPCPLHLRSKPSREIRGCWNPFTGFIVIGGLGGRLYMKLLDKLTD